MTKKVLSALFLSVFFMTFYAFGKDKQEVPTQRLNKEKAPIVLSVAMKCQKCEKKIKGLFSKEPCRVETDKDLDQVMIYPNKGHEAHFTDSYLTQSLESIGYKVMSISRN